MGRLLLVVLVALFVVRISWWWSAHQVDQRPVVAHDVFLVQSIKKNLDNYQSYGLLERKAKQFYQIRCFGQCPLLQVGETWLLYYRSYQSKRAACYGFMCHRPHRHLATLQAHQPNQRLVPNLSPGFHARYLSLLSRWFSDQSVVAVFSALTLNDKRYFTRDIWRVFKRTGTSHLVAMSGLHVGLAVGLVVRSWVGLLAYLFPLLVSRWVLVLCFVLVSLMGVLLFAWVSVSYSIERALLMTLVSSVMAACGCYLSLRYLLGIALVLLLLLDPGVIFSVGAWLSFFTVWILVRYSSEQQGLDSLWYSDPLRYGVIFLYLLPVCLYCFHTASLLSPLVNLWVVPWFSLTVIPLLVLSLFSSWFALGLAKYLALLAAAFFKPAYVALQWLSELSHSQLSVKYFSLLTTGLWLLSVEVCLWLIFNRSYGIMRTLVDWNKRKNEYKQ
jgi:ComEC/Rec2-related protein